MNLIRLSFLVGFAVLAAGGPVYNVYDLGSLGGPSAAFGLSSDGFAAGTSRCLRARNTRF